MQYFRVYFDSDFLPLLEVQETVLWVRENVRPILFEPRPRTPHWQAPSARFMRPEEVITEIEVDDYHPPKKGGSDFCEYHGILAVNARAKTILYSLTANQVEFLPLNSQDGEYWLLNVLAIAHFDSERSVLSYREDGSVRGGKHFVFAQQELLGKHIFRIPAYNYSRIYASQEFRELVETHQLTGLGWEVVEWEIVP